ncbi:MAG: nickel-responsive transcriptional regulator NikR [Spirochaetales bacterium]|nr:nickel-responsive transcriptional regulator NikR [Spirochaetales bacterium]
MIRISMSLSSELLKEFDEILQDRGYNSRSKGIRDALNDYILRYQWMNEMEGERIGIIAAIYDNHFVGVMEDLTSVQHNYREYINATMHIPLSEKQCLEVIVVKGDANNIRELTEKIMRLRGVEHVRLTSTGIKEN